MNKIFICILLSFSTINLSSQEIIEEKKAISATLDLEVYNNYYWRGDYFYADGVPAFQPYLTLSSNYVPIVFGLWYSTPLNKREEMSLVKDELEIVLSSEIDITDSFKITPGILAYLGTWAQDYKNTEELYLILHYTFGSGFGMATSFYFDVDAYKGVYFNLGPTHLLKFNDNLELKTAIILGFSKYKETSFSFIEAGVVSRMYYYLADELSLIPSILYNYNPDTGRNCYALSIGLGISL